MLIHLHLITVKPQMIRDVKLLLMCVNPAISSKLHPAGSYTIRASLLREKALS